jgi:peroxiredoxin (alkyl hydroperoxide reductase subunit C)
MPTPRVGDPAPDFHLKGPGGQFVTLSEFRGRRPVVLLFFPLAFSPVCSHQLPMVQTDLGRFEELGAAVLGISVDSHWANEAFAQSLGLTFPLLSDFRRKAMRAYGVLLDQAGYSARALFVIDRDGRIAHVEAPDSQAQIPSNARAIEVLETLVRG